MKKWLAVISVLGTSLLFSGNVFVQGMMDFSNSSIDASTIQSQQQEEQEGKTLLDSLSNKTITCSQVTDADFEKIGEYFMGQSIGDTARHITMNEMMKRMMSEQGEEQAHIAMGKRLSGCDTSAVFPSRTTVGFMSMMGGGVNFGYMPFSGIGGLLMILWWVLVIIGIVTVIKWLSDQSRKTNKK